MKAKFEKLNDHEGYFFILSEGIEKKVLARASISGKWSSYEPITDLDAKLIKDPNGLDVTFRKENRIYRYLTGAKNYKGVTRPEKCIYEK